jgi:hypothetical protein
MSFCKEVIEMPTPKTPDTPPNFTQPPNLPPVSLNSRPSTISPLGARAQGVMPYNPARGGQTSSGNPDMAAIVQLLRGQKAGF